MFVKGTGALRSASVGTGSSPAPIKGPPASRAPVDRSDRRRPRFVPQSSGKVTAEFTTARSEEPSGPGPGCHAVRARNLRVPLPRRSHCAVAGCAKRRTRGKERSRDDAASGDFGGLQLHSTVTGTSGLRSSSAVKKWLSVRLTSTGCGSITQAETSDR